MSRAAAKRFQLTSYFHSTHPIKLNQIESNEVQDPAYLCTVTVPVPPGFAYPYRLSLNCMWQYWTKKKESDPIVDSAISHVLRRGFKPPTDIVFFGVRLRHHLFRFREEELFNSQRARGGFVSVEIIDGDKCDNDNDNRPSTINERRVPER